MLKTTDGKQYWSVTVNKVDPYSISFTHDKGAATVPFDQFTAGPPDIKKIYGYDPTLAAEYQKAQADYQAAQDADAQKQAQAAAETQREQDWIKQNEVQVGGKVVQVLSDGVLLDDGSRMFIVTGVRTDNVADGDQVSIMAIPAGTTQYTTVLGAQATVRAYTAVTPDKSQ